METVLTGYSGNSGNIQNLDGLQKPEIFPGTSQAK